ncbi:MAG: DUF4145 domain-containing protein [Actinomycetota bacterium]|nr:DUF4145 domain-containing protein [Actinomycetota bacterium]
MIFKADHFGVNDPGAVVASLRCPACRQQGTFEPVGAQDTYLTGGNAGSHVWLGQRRCPNPDCHAHIFFAWDGQRVIVSYPPETIDFDATNIPVAIVSAFEEAITCHAASCFTAAAIMVRKTLEELCTERAASGANLKERLKALGSKVVLPKELIDGLDDLRLLGNDAAHIESKEYDKVGQEEVEVGIEFTKEVLKAVYQYSSLLARLRALKKNP